MAPIQASPQDEQRDQLSFVDSLFPGNLPHADFERRAFPIPWRVRELPPPNFLTVPLYGIKLVRLNNVTIQGDASFNDPTNAARILWTHLRDADREHLIGAYLTTKNTLIGLSVISMGDLTSAPVHPREVYKPAILMSAAGMILAHNHPSGDPTPSAEDIAVTRRVAEAGVILGVELLDHIVLGGAGRFVSLRASGYF